MPPEICRKVKPNTKLENTLSRKIFKYAFRFSVNFSWLALAASGSVSMAKMAIKTLKKTAAPAAKENVIP